MVELITSLQQVLERQDLLHQQDLLLVELIRNHLLTEVLVQQDLRLVQNQIEVLELNPVRVLDQAEAITIAEATVLEVAQLDQAEVTTITEAIALEALLNLAEVTIIHVLHQVEVIIEAAVLQEEVAALEAVALAVLLQKVILLVLLQEEETNTVKSYDICNLQI